MKLKAQIIAGDLHVGKKLWDITGETDFSYWLKRGKKVMLMTKKNVKVIEVK